jgi:uncharacterized membrane protein YbaN (DUF454 family)
MRRFHLWLGYASIALGAMGVVLSLLPTTPFLLVAVWCFGRSNPALANRLYGHPRFGSLLTTWRDQWAIRRRAKAVAVAMLALSFGLAVWLTGSPAAAVLLGMIMGSVALYLVTRPSP